VAAMCCIVVVFACNNGCSNFDEGQCSILTHNSPNSNCNITNIISPEVTYLVITMNNILISTHRHARNPPAPASTLHCKAVTSSAVINESLPALGKTLTPLRGYGIIVHNSHLVPSVKGGTRPTWQLIGHTADANTTLTQHIQERHNTNFILLAPPFIAYCTSFCPCSPLIHLKHHFVQQVYQ
jgi:hypothetical protein